MIHRRIAFQGVKTRVCLQKPPKSGSIQVRQSGEISRANISSQRYAQFY